MVRSTLLFFSNSGGPPSRLEVQRVEVHLPCFSVNQSSFSCHISKARFDILEGNSSFTGMMSIQKMTSKVPRTGAIPYFQEVQFLTFLRFW